MRIDDQRTDSSGAGGASVVRRPLRIVHVFRAPVGGLFRHVRDLAEAQHAAGHLVGIVCDSETGGAFEDEALSHLAPNLALGLKRLPMRRAIAPSDLAATARLLSQVRRLNPDVLHAHGAKGGAYARVIGTILRASGSRVVRIYSPHGGSLHYDQRAFSGRVYFAAERALQAMTDGFVFVSQFEADTYARKVGQPKVPVTVAPNGLAPEEFVRVAPHPNARDFLFIGALRDLKGVDVFIEALAMLRDELGRDATAVIVGEGPDADRYASMVDAFGLGDAVTFRGPMPARDAFPLARAIVVPSRAESMPYIVLEAVAAGMPIVATNVGGIPEIFGPLSTLLVPPGEVRPLADALADLLAHPGEAEADTDALRGRIRSGFSLDAMAGTIVGAYRKAL
jgi:glycosyltransferase involved in cell wall biosynthesis